MVVHGSNPSTGDVVAVAGRPQELKVILGYKVIPD